MTQIHPGLSKSTKLDSTLDLFLSDVLAGLSLTQKTLPCKYFYDERGSALFDQICELDEYYLTRVELTILRAHAQSMAEEVGEDVDLIEFGSGSSIKTRLLLGALPFPRAYIPIDISGEHLERSAHALSLRFPSLTVLPVAADFTGPFDLPDTGDPRARRVVYFPGSTIGNFSPDSARTLLGQIAEMVGHGGGLLIGFDIEKDASILLPAYNDHREVTAAFNLNVLTRINRELEGNFDLDAFNHKAIYNRSQERVEMHLISQVDQRVRIAGAEIVFLKEESILTECSYKYPLEHFARLTSDAGFTTVCQWTDVQGYFSVQYLTVAD